MKIGSKRRDSAQTFGLRRAFANCGEELLDALDQSLTRRTLLTRKSRGALYPNSLFAPFETPAVGAATP